MVSSAVKEHKLLYPSLGRNEFSDMFKESVLDCFFFLVLTLVSKTQIQIKYGYMIIILKICSKISLK